MQPPDKGRGGNSSFPKNNRQNKGKGKTFLTEFPPLGKQQQKPQTAKDILKKEVIYTKKLVTEKVLTVSFEDVQWKSDPWHIKERYLGTQHYPVQDGRHRYIYEAMLLETESIQLVHHHQNTRDYKSPITHSKCYILKVLHPTEWSLDPSRARKLELTGQQFNYWDYQLAWSFAFYYQNPTHKHTWFFNFNPEIVLKRNGFPNWFLHWWEKFGPEFTFLPAPLTEPWLKWYEHHPKLRGKTAKDEPLGLSALTYMAEFQIPWIWRWGLEFDLDDKKLPSLYRSFFYKWWDGFDFTETLQTICETTQQYIKDYQQTHSPDPPTAANIFQFLLTDIQKCYPNLSPLEQQIKITELLKNQFLANQEMITQPEPPLTSPLQKNEGSGTVLLTSSFSALAGESQDPYEDNADDDVSMADYWDGLIGLQEEKLRKAKGKTTTESQ